MDSLGVALSGVRVGVIGSKQEVYSDAEGVFSITGLTEGRYQVRFVAPELESAGFIPPPVAQDVIRGEVAQMEYHMPSMGDVLFEVCRGEERPEGSVVLAGTVVDDLGRPVPDAAVRVRWTEYGVRGGGNLNLETVDNLTVDGQGLEATTGAAGGYHFCGVPPDMPLQLSAWTIDRTSAEVEVFVSPDGVGATRVLELSKSR